MEKLREKGFKLDNQPKKGKMDSTNFKSKRQKPCIRKFWKRKKCGFFCSLSIIYAHRPISASLNEEETLFNRPFFIGTE